VAHEGQRVAVLHAPERLDVVDVHVRKRHLLGVRRFPRRHLRRDERPGMLARAPHKQVCSGAPARRGEQEPASGGTPHAGPQIPQRVVLDTDLPAALVLADAAAHTRLAQPAQAPVLADGPSAVVHARRPSPQARAATLRLASRGHLRLWSCLACLRRDQQSLVLLFCASLFKDTLSGRHNTHRKQELAQQKVVLNRHESQQKQSGQECLGDRIIRRRGKPKR